ncbi:hypothetical protein CK203_047277 [Vitis vinifera]|uniref:Ubiquitin-like protease family profile domain-containing protein n=1 Tax=Vitis vinifera TaxID=29760 RepID=A0A438HZ12_VITVI|nr:hypothetical protein CK203_047277 [Vitis vinifera]
MVPIRYNSWRDVLILVKNNLWDTIEASFTLDSKSKRNCMLMMGKCFQSFKNMLTIKYVIPFKDQPEDFREVKKERRKKHIYNHHLSRKGYAGLEDEMVVVEQPKYEVDGHVPTVQKANKVRKCQLAIFCGLDYFFFRTKENVVAAGTIILECGVNFLVVVDASYEPNAPLLVHIPNQITTIGEALGYQVLWPTQMVSLTTHPIQDEDLVDIKNFATLVRLLLKEGKVHAVNITKNVFGESCKSFHMNDDTDIIISLTEVSSYYLMTICFCKSKAGIGEANKESRSRVIANQLMNANHAEFIFIPYNPVYHWVLVALYIRTMIAYFLDSLQDQPSDDLKKIVNIQSLQAEGRILHGCEITLLLRNDFAAILHSAVEFLLKFHDICDTLEAEHRKLKANFATL